MITEGSSKLASVPSGGAGGAPAAGGAAAGGAAAGGEEAAEEKKEEGMQFQSESGDTASNILYREGGVRRGYGFRSLRLRNQKTFPGTEYPGSVVYRQGFWERLCVLCVLLHAVGVKGRIMRSSREETQPWTLYSITDKIDVLLTDSKVILAVIECLRENQVQNPVSLSEVIAPDSN